MMLSPEEIKSIDRALIAHAQCGRDFGDEATRLSILSEVINREIYEHELMEFPDDPDALAGL